MNAITFAASPARSQVSEILVIEDDPLQAHEIADFLGRQGFSVSKRAGGSDSLHGIAGIDPTVVIVDYHLPDIDGMTVIERIHRLVPRAAVILMSGRIDFLPNDVLDRYGVVAFLRKPISLGNLRRLVSRLLKNPQLTRHELRSPLARLLSPEG